MAFELAPFLQPVLKKWDKLTVIKRFYSTEATVLSVLAFTLG